MLSSWIASAAWIAGALSQSSVAQAAALSDSRCQSELNLSVQECKEVRKWVLPKKIPPARENEVADSDTAAYLGYRIFYNPAFSNPTGLSCAHCHSPEQGFTDRRATSLGKNKKPVARNAPTLLNAARLKSFFWDGRAHRLQDQPLMAFENPAEMDITRVDLVLRVRSYFGKEYQKVFGPFPDDLKDSSHFPVKAKPGTPEWDQMTPKDRHTIDRLASNVSKAIEAFLRKVAAGPSPIDDYISGRSPALDATARKGLQTFVRVGCVSCHGGPMLSDEKFYSLGFPTPPGTAVDRGIAAIRIHPASQDEGAFRTPSLRNVDLSPPYGHNGALGTLEKVIQAHPNRVLRRPIAADELYPLAFFLTFLNGKLPAAPWNQWPFY